MSGANGPEGYGSMSFREKLLSVAVAFATFSVVTGSIVTVGLLTAEPALAALVVR